MARRAATSLARDCDLPHMTSRVVCIDDEIIAWLEAPRAAELVKSKSR
jgi:hypothetical protein